MTEAELHAEAKRRTQQANPQLSDEQWNAWLALALSRGANIVLQLDGCRAAYPIPDANMPPPRGSNNK
ncbi:MAG TPA: hypothetical protein VFK05_12480 [Polyangiaceae bacterium]|nr:hypothetical protein [Polyangiaceae bacterium]